VTVKRLLTSLLLILVAAGVGSIAPSVFAQAKAPAVAAAPAVQPGVSTAPKFSEDDVIMLQAVATVGPLANNDCQGLESVKKFQAQRNQVLARIETKYSGYTIDWAAGVLVAKAPAPK
jgi:hypothetical protein